MRVLLIEDHTQLAGLVSRELRQEYDYEVTSVRNPIEAAERYQDETYDVVVVDMLYEQLSREFDERRTVGRRALTGGRLLVSGLTAVSDVGARSKRTGVVLWTSGEANRRLHLLYAYEDLGVRVFCSKSAGTGDTGPLREAMSAAVAGRAHVDPVLNAYLPVDGAPTVSATFLRDKAKRSIWRCLALGARSRGEISEISGYSTRTVGNLISGMLEDVMALDPGVRRTGAPMSEVASYASRNWEFLLDDVVRARYP